MQARGGRRLLAADGWLRPALAARWQGRRAISGRHSRRGGADAMSGRSSATGRRRRELLLLSSARGPGMAVASAQWQQPCRPFFLPPMPSFLTGKRNGRGGSEVRRSGGEGARVTTADSGPDATASTSPLLQRHHETRELPFSAQHVQHIVASVSEYHAFVPWCSGSKIIRRYDHNTFDAELTVGFKLFVERYTSRVVVVPGKSVTATSKDTGLFRHLRTRWTFTPISGDVNACKVEFDVEFEFHSRIYSSASAHFLSEVVEKMVGAFEQRCASIMPNDNHSVKPYAPAASASDSSNLFSSSELDAVHAKFAQVVSGAESSSGMSLEQFKSMYVSLFRHTAEESMENLHHDSAPSQAVLTDNAGADRENIDNIAAVRLGTLMTRSITESDLEIVAARHFRVLDTDGNGSLDKLEFVAGMGTLFKGSIEQQWKSRSTCLTQTNGFVTHQTWQKCLTQRHRSKRKC